MVFSILNLSILVKDCEDLFFFYQEKFINNKCLTHGRKMFPAGLEPATFRVWGGRDNHYTTETHTLFQVDITYFYRFQTIYRAFSVTSPTIQSLTISKQWW